MQNTATCCKPLASSKWIQKTARETQGEGMMGGTQIQRNYFGFWKSQSPRLSLREYAQKVSLLVLLLSRYLQLLCKTLAGWTFGYSYVTFLCKYSCLWMAKATKRRWQPKYCRLFLFSQGVEHLSQRREKSWAFLCPAYVIAGYSNLMKRTSAGV